MLMTFLLKSFSSLENNGNNLIFERFIFIGCLVSILFKDTRDGS